MVATIQSEKNIFMFLSYKYAYVQNGVKSCYINKVTGEWLENHVQPFGTLIQMLHECFYLDITSGSSSPLR